VAPGPDRLLVELRSPESASRARRKYASRVSGDYTIAGGLADAQRLARQAHVMHDATEALLSRVGVRSGWSCLDVGCGDGQVTMELARIVGPNGRIVGIDIDAAALELARRNAIEAGMRVEFVQADATGLLEHGGFDLAYSRLLLSHLLEPLAALRSMSLQLRSGGAVAVEDLFLGTLRSDPPAPALDWLQEVYGATVRFHGGDPTIGPRLRALLSAAGLVGVEEHTVTNRIATVEDKLFLAQLVRNMRASTLAAGAATESELDTLQVQVERAARSPDSTFYQARIHQVWGRRPADPRSPPPAD
jgi:SAM-dependent methyltransferase